MTKIEPHWPNPWTEAIYVPLDELALCVAGGNVQIGDRIVPYTQAVVLEHWRSMGERLDAYILRNAFGGPIYSEVGVRYGAAADEYLSPYPRHKDRVQALLAKYGATP